MDDILGKIAGGAIAGGVDLGKKIQPPQRTTTEITLHSNQLVLAVLTNDEDGSVVQYQLRFFDPYLNRTIIYGIDPLNAAQFHKEFGEMISRDK